MLVLAFAVALIGSVALFQRYGIYSFTSETGTPADYDLDTVKEVGFVNLEDRPLRAWISPPSRDMPVIISFYGNGGQLGGSMLRLKGLIEKGYGIAMLEYRDAGRFSHDASEDAYADDARALYDQLDTMFALAIPASQRAIHGFSVGSSIAAHLAQSRPAGALILEASFDKSCRYHRQRLHGIPMCQLMWRERHDVVNQIQNIEMPVLVAHGAQDASVPVAWAKALYDAIPSKKEFQVYDPGAHTNLFDRGLTEDVDTFLRGALN